MKSNIQQNCSKKTSYLQKDQHTLNTYVVKAFCTPVGGQGGSLWTLTQKSTFPNEFGCEMRATDRVIQKNQNTAKKIENRIYNYKMVAKKTILISQHKISDQKWENHFPEGIFP